MKHTNPRAQPAQSESAMENEEDWDSESMDIDNSLESESEDSSMLHAQFVGESEDLPTSRRNLNGKNRLQIHRSLCSTFGNWTNI